MSEIVDYKEPFLTEEFKKNMFSKMRDLLAYQEEEPEEIIDSISGIKSKWRKGWFTQIAQWFNFCLKLDLINENLIPKIEQAVSTWANAEFSQRDTVIDDIQNGNDLIELVLTQIEIKEKIENIFLRERLFALSNLLHTPAKTPPYQIKIGVGVESKWRKSWFSSVLGNIQMCEEFIDNQELVQKIANIIQKWTYGELSEKKWIVREDIDEGDELIVEILKYFGIDVEKIKSQRVAEDLPADTEEEK